ncbi:MAG: hypothetical protein ACRDZO_09790 [Egibacteraceae bacterium]
MFERAHKVADAVLYEGYVLYPYRASAKKNRARWQWGVVVPRAYREAGGSDTWDMQTEVLVEGRDDTRIQLQVRFLQVQARVVEQAGEPVAELEVGDEMLVTWDEGVPHEIDAEVRLEDLPTEIPLAVPGGREVEDITDDVRVVRERWPVTARLLLAAEALPGPYGIYKLQARIENVTPWEDLSPETPLDRDLAVRRALIATHILIATDGKFVSLLDPPEWAAPYSAMCENAHTWPVLVEDEDGDVVLSSPIILYDYPEIAPESPGELCDSLEIDEILTLRTMTLTDAEKREARATDPRAKAIIDRSDAMPAEVLDRLHGAIRYLRSAGPSRGDAPEREPDQPLTLASSAADGKTVPWWDPGTDASVSPETDRVWVGGVSVGKGSKVRLRPGSQRADAQDMFLADRIGMVEAVLFSVDGDTYLAVTLEDDPEAAEVQRWHGRYLYFSPDEVVPLSSGEDQS